MLFALHAFLDLSGDVLLSGRHSSTVFLQFLFDLSIKVVPDLQFVFALVEMNQRIADIDRLCYLAFDEFRQSLRFLSFGI